MHCFKSLFHKSKEAKIQRSRKNIFTKLSFFRVSVKSFIRLFSLFLTKRATVQNIKHVSVFQTGRRGLV